MIKIIRIPCMDFILLLIKRRIWIFVYCFCFELDISLPYLNSMNSVYKIPVFLKYAVWVPHLRGFEKRLFSVVLVFALFQFSFIL